MEYIYKTSITNKLGDLFTILLMLGVGFYLLIEGNQSVAIISILLFASCVGLSIMFLKDLTKKILISDDSIEQSDIFGKRHILTNNIAGWRIMRSGGGRSRVVYSVEIDPKDKKQDKTIKVSSSVKVDGIFKSWLMKFPDLTTYGSMFFNLDRLKTSPKYAAKLAAPEYAAKIAALENSPLFIPPEKMVEAYFAQWNL